MGAEGLKLFELVLLPGLIFAWGFWELYKLDKDKKQRAAADRRDDSARSEGPEDGAS